MNYLQKKIRTLLFDKENKIVAQNFAYLTLLQVAGFVFPLITMPYLARVIGVDGFGKIAFASAVMIWIQTIADWGFNYTATRDIAKNRDNLKIVSEIFSNVLWARCFLALLSFLLLILLITIIPSFYKNYDILLVSYLMIPGHILFPDWFFQAMERMRYITILNIISKAIFTIAVFLFIREKEDYILQPLLFSLGYIMSGVIAFYYILVRWNVKLMCTSITKIIFTIKNSSDVFLNNLMPNLYNSFSTVLLGIFSGDIANGKLEAGSKFVIIAQQFMHVLSRAFFPFLSRKLDKHSIYVRLNIVCSFVISAFLFLFAPLIINFFFTQDFADSIIVLRIMSLSIIFLALSNIYGTNYMIIAGYECKLRKITTVVSIIGFIIAFPLIIEFGYIGAATTILLSRAMLGISIMIYAMQIKSKYKYIS